MLGTPGTVVGRTIVIGHLERERLDALIDLERTDRGPA